MNSEFTGKRVVITGGSRGLGFAMARAFLEAGAEVTIASRNAESVDAAQKTLSKDGGEVLGFSCDVGDWDQIHQLGQSVVDRWGYFDIWINNAGLSPAYGPTWEIPMERIEMALQTNIHGVAYGSWLAIHHFQQRGRGVLMNILGRGADRKAPSQNAYGSSKAWVRAFTRNLAAEIDNPEIRVIAYNPGLVYTDLVEQVQTVPSARDRLDVFGRVLTLLGNPPEVPARRAVWLASEAGRRAGVEYSLNSIGSTFGRFLSRGFQILLGKRPKEHEVAIQTIEPASTHLPAPEATEEQKLT